MRVIYLKLDEIDFEYTEYSQELADSVVRSKIQIAIRVKVENERFTCIDGNKRLSILRDLNMDIKIPAVLVNDFSKQGSTYWGDMNHH